MLHQINRKYFSTKKWLWWVHLIRRIGISSSKKPLCLGLIQRASHSGTTWHALVHSKQGSLCAPDNWSGSWLSTESGTPWWVCGSLNWRDIPSHDYEVRVQRPWSCSFWFSCRIKTKYPQTNNMQLYILINTAYYLISLLHVYNVINACMWLCIRQWCIVCSFAVCALEVLAAKDPPQGVTGFRIIAFSRHKTPTGGLMINHYYPVHLLHDCSRGNTWRPWGHKPVGRL